MGRIASGVMLQVFECDYEDTFGREEVTAVIATYKFESKVAVDMFILKHGYDDSGKKAVAVVYIGPALEQGAFHPRTLSWWEDIPTAIAWISQHRSYGRRYP